MTIFIFTMSLLIYLVNPANAKSINTIEVSIIDTMTRPIRIAVVDTGLNDQYKYNLCKTGHISFYGNSTEDEVGHGSQIVEIIDSQARKSGRNYCFVIIKALGKGKRGVDDSRFLDAIKHLSELPDIDIVNMSIAGFAYIPEEIKYLKSMLKRKVVIVVAAGNNHTKLTHKECKVYPACDDNRILVVGQKDNDVSNYGPVVDVVVNGIYKLNNGQIVNGTSISAAFTTGTILRLLK